MPFTSLPLTFYASNNKYILWHHQYVSQGFTKFHDGSQENKII